MNHLNPHKVGLALGGLLGLAHVAWSALVAFGWAQPLINWVMGLHMIQESVVVLPFMWQTALGLVVTTAVVGYVFGYAFAMIWNKVQK